MRAASLPVAPAGRRSASLWPALAAVPAVLALAAPPFMGEYALQIGFRLLILLAIAEAWNLLAGYTGLVSLGSAAFVGAGGYLAVAGMNQLGLPLAAALALSGLGGAGLGFVVSGAVFRMRGLYFTVGTLALAEALRLFMVNVPTFGGAAGMFLDQDPVPAGWLYLYALGLLGITTLIMTVATQTRVSVILRAVRDDEDAAAGFGVRPFRVKLAAFMLAGCMMGMAGGLQGYKLGAVEPYGMFGLGWSVDALSIVLIGGLGLRLGPAVGAVFVVGLGELLADYPELHIALTGVILVVLIRFAPKGLCGLASTLLARRRAA